MDNPQIVLLGLFFAFSLGLFVWAVISINEEARSGAEEVDELFTDGPIFRVLLPYIQTLGARIEDVRAFDEQRASVREQLVAAGKGDAITPSEFIATQMVSGIAAALGGVLFNQLLELGMVVELIIAGLLAGFLLPKLSLRSAIKLRQKLIRRVLPYTLDLLTLAVEAGLDFTTALSRIGSKLGDNPFGPEIKRLVRDLTMGKTRKQALTDLADRTGVEELKTIVAALVQADELGASLGPTLRIQAAEMRRRRFDAAEKAAMEAPVKMLFPLIAFIFPTVFLIIFGPIGISLMKTKG